MQTTFTLEFMKRNCGCYSWRQLSNCSFMQTANETISLIDIFASEIPLKDKFWFFCHKVATDGQNKQVAIMVAETVAHVYQETFPKDSRVIECVEAAKQYLCGTISEYDVELKRRSAYACYLLSDYETASFVACAVVSAADAVIGVAVDANSYVAAAYACSAAYLHYRNTRTPTDELSIKLLYILIDFVTNNK